MHEMKKDGFVWHVMFTSNTLLTYIEENVMAKLKDALMGKTVRTPKS